MMNMQRSGTGMSAVSTGGLSRTNTGMSVGGGGDIQNTAQDIVGWQGPVFDGGQPYPVLGFGFCATKGRRPHNEDRVMLTPRLGGNSNYNFYGVLDGHAGAQASEFAKNDLPSRLARKLGGRGPLGQQEAQGFFHQIFTECDQAWLQQAKARNARDGTTACTVLVSGTDLFCANVGDSEAVLCRKDGSGVKIAKTHKPSDSSEAARIRQLGGKVSRHNGVVRVEDDLSVSRAIGDAPLKQFIVPDPSVTYRKLDQNDEYIIIGSDGLWDFMGPNTAALTVHRTADAQAAAKRLVEAAISAGTTDNVGVVVVDLRHIWEREPPPPAPVGGCCTVS